MIKYLLFGICIGQLFKISRAIIAYDCSQQVSNLTTFSLINIGECDIETPEVNTTRVFVRLLQLNEFSSIRVKLCKVEVKRNVRYCGAFSHRKDVEDGEVKFLDEVTAEECYRMHNFRQYRHRDELISNLRVNATTVHPMTFVGKVDRNGNCDNAGTYSDPFGKFSDVVVTGYLTITLKEYEATANLNTNEIILRSGTRCTFTQDQCIDTEEGYAFWEPIPPTICESNKYAELYAGEITKIIEKGNERRPTYIMESDEITFAFMSIGTIPVCSYELIRTEHPKLIFLEGLQTEYFHTVKTPSINNLDIFAYVNSKFVYVEKHIKGQIKRLYHDLVLQKCELEKRVIANALSIATAAPDLFAYQIAKKSGYMGLVAGEVVHLMKCIQVEVHRREETACYQELPVTKDGKNYFLTPRTHILKNYGTETTCNPLIPPMFQLENEWYTILPGTVTKGIQPSILKPNTQAVWNYTDPASLAKSGIYTSAQVQALKNHIMFPVERPAVLNSIAMSMSGRSSRMDGLSAARLFDEEAMSRLAESTWSKIWVKFLTFGSASAGVIGIFLIARLIKFIADTIIHGYALHSIYGFSVYILGAAWNSVTQLLLHIGRDKERKNNRGETDRSEEKIEGSPTETIKQQLAQPKDDGAPGAYTPGGGEQQLRYQAIANQLYPVLQQSGDNFAPQKPPRRSYQENV